MRVRARECRESELKAGRRRFPRQGNLALSRYKTAACFLILVKLK